MLSDRARCGKLALWLGNLQLPYKLSLLATRLELIYQFWMLIKYVRVCPRLILIHFHKRYQDTIHTFYGLKYIKRS